MSWESSALYYRIINERVKAKLGGLHSARCILYSIDFSEIETYQKQGKWSEAAHILVKAAKSLQLVGADFVVICTNTMHKVAQEIEEQIGITLLHIADMTADTILSEGIKTIGLLGTRYTMEQEFYKSRLVQKGIQVLIPEEDDRYIVNRIIYEELCLGQIKQDSKLKYKKIIEKLVCSGAEGIILGCTEIGLLVKSEDATVPLFDTTVIHAEGAVDKALDID